MVKDIIYSCTPSNIRILYIQNVHKGGVFPSMQNTAFLKLKAIAKRKCLAYTKFFVRADRQTDRRTDRPYSLSVVMLLHL